MRRRFHADRGFTLIEIMLVLTLLVILSSITMPSIRGFAASTRLKSSARTIQDLLHFARDMAITERIGYLVVFDFDQNRFWLASSETFDSANASASLASNASQLRTPLTDQQTPLSESGQTMRSRTGSILGIPQALSDQVSLSRMTTNRNMQSNQITSGSDYVYFSPNGSSEDAVVYIQDRRGKAMSVTVESATGRVRLEQLSQEESEALGIFAVNSE